MSPCYEIVTYTVADPDQADAARAAARILISAFPGFVSWTEFSGAGDPAKRVDLLVWRSEADARSAARAVGEDAAFAGFRASIEQMQGMDHYRAARAPAALRVGEGVELGRFRLKPGVGEADMRSAHQKMIDGHLSKQPGWVRQNLVAVGDGRFIDLAFATDRNHAEAICAGWAGQSACEAFLCLIEPEDMTFGTVV